MRASSETKATPPKSRVTRAGSVELDVAKAAPVAAIKRRTRATMVPSDLIAINEAEEVKKRGYRSLESAATEADDNNKIGIYLILYT